MQKPTPNLFAAKILDATPKSIVANGTRDTHALFATIDANRLIDVFLGISSQRLQGALARRLRVEHFYHGVEPRGDRLVIAVYSNIKHANLRWMSKGPRTKSAAGEPVRRMVTAQFIGQDSIAMFNWGMEAGVPKVVNEAHYQLVGARRRDRAVR